MEKQEIKSRIEQLLTLYYLSREVMGRNYYENANVLMGLSTDSGICLTAVGFWNDLTFIKNMQPKWVNTAYWWQPPCQAENVPSQRRAIEVRIKFLEKELNRFTN